MEISIFVNELIHSIIYASKFFTARKRMRDNGDRGCATILHPRVTTAPVQLFRVVSRVKQVKKTTQVHSEKVIC